MPWATFSDTEKMADAALSAKTLVAEVRARDMLVRGARRAGIPGPASKPCLEAAVLAVFFR